MKLNKYRLGSTINYNFTSPQEYQQRSMYMRGMHDLTQQALLDQEGALQFEYADVDDPYVSPKVEALQNKISNTEQQLLTQGYNPTLQNNLVQLRKEYMREAGPKGTIGRAQSNYKAMQQALSDYDKAHAKDPEWFREAAKKNIIANYKGMQDEAGNFVEFTPGRATGYRDIGEDFLSYAKNYSGVSEDDLGKFMTGQIGMHAVQGPNGQTYLQVVEKTPGTRITNKPQLEALLNEFYAQYTDPNTDRGLFAQLAQKSPEEIQRTLGNMSQVAGVSKYGMNPGWNASVQRVPEQKVNRETSTNPSFGNFTFPANNSITYNPKLQKELNRELEEMQGAFTNGMIDPKEPEPKSPWHPSSMWEDIKESFEVFNPKYTIINPTDEDLKLKEKINPHQKIWDETTKKFSGLYDRYTKGELVVNGKPITNDEDFYNYTVAARQKYTAIMDSKTNLVLPDTYDALNRLIYAPDNNETFVSLDGNDTMSWAKIKEKYEDADWDIKDMTAWMNSDGAVEVRVPVKKDKVESYVVSGLPQSQVGKQFDQTLQQLKTIFEDYEWDSKEIEAQNSPNNAIPLTGSVNNPQPQDLALKVYVDPNDVTNKPMYLLQYKEITDKMGMPTGQYSWVQSNEPVTKSELMQMATFGKASLLNQKFK